jgi:O-antigen/teichoic acid export membrane protein
LIKQIVNRIFYSGDVMVLLLGTAIAQVISLGAAPVLTSLFTPEQFGVFGLLMAVFNPLSTLASGRMEPAIVLPDEEHKSKQLILLCWIFSLLLFVLVFVFSLIYPALGLSDEYYFIVQCLPFLLLFTGLYQPLNYYFQRTKAFRNLSTVKIVQTFSIALISIALGYFKNQHGMIIGYLSGWVILGLIAFAILSPKVLTEENLNKGSLLRVLKDYKAFPLYNAPTAFISSLSLSVPVFVLISYYSEREAGLFNLTRQILFIPTSLIATAFAQVYFQQFADEFKSNGNLKTKFVEMLYPLVIIALCFAIPIFFFGEQLFELIFGETWKMSGTFASMLVAATALQFIAIPLSSVFMVVNRIKQQAVWQIAYFVLILSLFIFHQLPINDFVYLLLMIDLTAYLVLLVMIVYYIRKSGYFSTELKRSK